ncbi:DUF6668 family protein [Streptomyces diacarni]|uniref:DUF6668 family protein n=1 Tax=Streptomyces diacarni TaxID=2800381 RepID=UPI003404F03B
MSSPGAAPAGAPSAAPGQAPGHPAPRQVSAPGGISAPGGALVSWVGAHGGAGTSTLAEVVGGSDLGRHWPDPSQGDSGRVLLVARTHASGLRAASRALEALHTGQHPEGVELLAVVLVADAPGRLPLHLLQRVRVLRSVAEVRRVPWVPAWRGEKRAGALPKGVRSLAALAGSPIDKPLRHEGKR